MLGLVSKERKGGEGEEGRGREGRGKEGEEDLVVAGIVLSY